MKSIFLYPYGGGSAASYRSFAGAFPKDVARIVPVEIPGHGKRSGEPFAASIQQCAEATLQQIDTGGDYILHGHCMGALLAFETVKLIAAQGAPPPLFMVASGRNAPRHTNAWLNRIAALDDRGLFREMQDIGGIPRGLSFAMAQPFLAVIRGDEAMFRNYDTGEQRIDVPILVLAGRDDAMTNAAALADWRACTSRALSVEWLDGGHYFIIEQPDRVARCLEEFSRALNAATAA